MIRKFTEKHLHLHCHSASLLLCFLLLKLFFTLPLSALGVEGVSQRCLPGVEERLVPPRGHHPPWLRTHDLAERTTQLHLQGRRCVCVCALSELHHLRTTWTRLERLNKHQTFSNINSVFASSGSTCVWLSFSPVCSSS